MNFEKEGVVSVWYSTVPYLEIPDSYFEEDENGLDQWARNFQIGQYDAELLETNGTDSGTIAIIDAIGPCSYSCSYGEAVIHKINKIGDQQASWIILLFDYEYRPKKTKIHQDEYVKFVGAFPYDMVADSLIEPSE
ncbi:MAG: immunity 22 family protein [Amphritea sp.]